MRIIKFRTLIVIVHSLKIAGLRRDVLLYNDGGWVVYYNENILPLLIKKKTFSH
jgi:hypothetical protein